MSSFNILYADVQCSNCKNIYLGTIQFKFGRTWQLEYVIGDIVKWGGNNVGESNLLEVKVYGILEKDECPKCKRFNQNNEFDICIENDFIKEVKPIADPMDYSNEIANYKILKE